MTASTDSRVMINLGSGHWKFEGWVNVDLDPASLPDVCADLSAGLPFQDQCADFMHSEDFIDQLSLQQAGRLLRESHPETGRRNTRADAGRGTTRRSISAPSRQAESLVAGSCRRSTRLRNRGRNPQYWHALRRSCLSLRR
jgi:hypothetical protein